MFLRARLGPVVLLLALHPWTEGAAQTQDRARSREALVASLDSAAMAHVEGETVAGISVAVVRGADTLLLKGYGFVDLEWDVPTPPHATSRNPKISSNLRINSPLCLIHSF